MNDIFGSALLDYQNGHYFGDIVTISSLDETDTLPLPYIFRGFEDMPPLEQKALQLCRGDVLDIGCGAGSHSLYLQKKGFEVTGLDRSKGAIATCRMRGVKNLIRSDILDFDNGRFDTLLMLMNGIGIAGRLDRLGGFLEHLKGLLNPGGQIVLDSSDIIYMYDEDDDGGRWIPESADYYGEVEFTMQYKGRKGNPFLWLYVDYRTLEKLALNCGLSCELVRNGEHYDYLARLWQS